MCPTHRTHGPCQGVVGNRCLDAGNDPPDTGGTAEDEGLADAHPAVPAGQQRPHTAQHPYKSWDTERLWNLHRGAGHVSSQQIAETLGLDARFATMIDAAIKEYGGCKGCNEGKGRAKLPKASAPGHAHEAHHFNDRISLDYIVKFGNWNVIVIEDEYSRLVTTKCLRHRDADTTVTAYRSNWESDYYNPRRFRHDNDGGFVDLDDYLSGHGVKKEPIPPYSPELDGFNERSHGTLLGIYRAAIIQSGLPRTDRIRQLVMENYVTDVYNSLRHSVTKQAPIERALGIPTALQQHAEYFPGRPCLYKPAKMPAWRRHGNETWLPGKVVCKRHNNMVTVYDVDSKRIVDFTLGRVKFADYEAARRRAELDGIPIYHRPPWARMAGKDATSDSPRSTEPSDVDSDGTVDSRDAIPLSLLDRAGRSQEQGEHAPAETECLLPMAGSPQNQRTGRSVALEEMQRKVSLDLEKSSVQHPNDWDWSPALRQPTGASQSRPPATGGSPAATGQLPATTGNHGDHDDDWNWSPKLAPAVPAQQKQIKAPTREVPAKEAIWMGRPYSEPPERGPTTRNEPTTSAPAAWVTDETEAPYFRPPAATAMSALHYESAGAAVSKNQAVPASGLTPKEKQDSEAAEIGGFRENNVMVEVNENEAKQAARRKQGTIISTRFVYARKAASIEYPNGRVKARCVARGFQDTRPDVDANSPAASSDSRRTFLAVAKARRLCVAIADVKQAYTNADLLTDYDVYLVPPPGYTKPGKLWKLRKAVYGLSDAGTAWYECISARLQLLGWVKIPEDPCLYQRNGQMVALYVDDLLAASSTDAQAIKIINELGFKLGKARPLVSGDDFAGVYIEFSGRDFKTSPEIKITQKKYAENEINHCVWNRKSTTPLPTTLAQRERDKEEKLDSSGHRTYRSMIGKLMWLAVTSRPDLAYAASYLSRALASPSDRDFQLADRALAYAKATADECLIYPDIDWDSAELTVVADASFAAPRDDYKSQTGYFIVLHDKKKGSMLTWKSQQQKTKSAGSSMAAECLSAKVAWAHGIYLRDLIASLVPQARTLPVNMVTDNDDLYKMVKERKRAIPKDRSLTIAIHQLRESADLDRVSVLFQPGKSNPSDALTKPLPDDKNLIDAMKGHIDNFGKDLDPLGPKRK